jgi:hypothetical protein
MINTGGVNRFTVASTWGAFQIFDEVALTNRFYITTDGNVGIGTTSPALRGHIIGTAGLPASAGTTQLGALRLQTGTSTVSLDMGVNGGTGGWLQVTNANDLSLEYPLIFNPNGGNVLIGTTTDAGYKLDVNGTLRATGAATFSSTVDILSGNFFRYAGVTGVIGSGTSVFGGTAIQLGIRASNDILFASGGVTERMRITSSGNVGIGTTSPTFSAVSGNTVKGLHIQNIGNDTQASLRLTGHNNTGTPGQATFTELLHAGGSLRFDINHNGTTALSINPSSNVGIGTASPTQKLEVNGGAIGNSIARFTTGGGSGGTRGMTITSNDSQVKLQVSDNAGSVGPWAFLNLNPDGGNVGIGTTAPGAKLDIVSTGAGSEGLRVDGATGGFAFVVKGGSDYTSHMRAGATIGVNYFTTPPSNGLIVEGNVGIGTTAPQKPLEVISSANDFVSVGVQSLGVGQWTGIHFGYREPNANYRKSAIVFERTDLTASDAQGKIHILNGPQNSGASATLADAKLTIAENGNVGIGTTSPSSKLHVVGESKVTGSAAAYTFFDQANATYYSVWYRNDNITYLYDSYLNSIPFVINSSGNVGIGTTSPAYKLDVAGSVAFGATTRTEIGDAGTTPTVSYGMFHNNGVGLGIASLAGGSTQGIQFWSHNGVSFFESMKIAGSTGNVGIGTTSPNAKLHVYDNSDVWHTRIGGASGELRIGGQTPSGAVIQAYTPGGSVRQLYLQRDGGNVGIGTDSPTATLQINGGGGDSAPTLRLISAASDTFNWASDTRYANLTAGESSIHLIGKANSQYNQAYFGYRHVADGSASNMLTLGLYASDYLLNILGNGNVGIGTTSPTAFLHITGQFESNYAIKLTGTLGTGRTFGWKTNGGDSDVISLFDVTENSRLAYFSYTQIGFETSGVSRLYIAANGNVGIGTTAPNMMLSVKNLAGITNDGQISWGVGTGFMNWDTGYVSISGQSGTALVLGSNSTERMRITSSGNVGIGTISPDSKLVVSGSGQITTKVESSNNQANVFLQGTFGQFENLAGELYITNNAASSPIIFRAGSATERLRITSSGNVGIGTTAPDQALHVNGNVKIDGLVTDGPVVAAGGVLTAVLGYTGVVPIIGNPPGQQNLEFVNGILVNVF